MSESKSLLLAAFLSAIIVILWQFFFYTPVAKVTHGPVQELHNQNYPVEINKTRTRSESISEEPYRVKISTANLHGSISLKGAKFDDITLAQYHVSNDPQSSDIALFSPLTTKEAYFAEFGWVSLDKNLNLPNSNTIWSTDKDQLSTQEGINLKWDNGSGVLFKIRITVDDKYLFHIDQYVTNNTNSIIKLIPYGRLNRIKPEDYQSSFIFHEGPIGIFDDKFDELSYSKIKKKKLTHIFSKGWFGFADKYWFASIVPFSNKPINAHMKYINNKYQLDFTSSELSIEPKSTVSTFSYLFTGAKNIDILDNYSKSLNIKSFDRVVDFGILYFITKPIFLLLKYCYSLFGNFGLAILILTIFVRIILLPLSVKSTVSMLRMRSIKPELQNLKKLYANDKIQLNKEIMLLFKKNNITPMAGLLPSIMQIPIFFSLYKVLSITIEMRHAPFYGWIKDLSAKDPTNIFTLFGALNWNPPQMLSIGILPIILGITMLIQQKMNSTYQSYDSAQADVMKFMPYIFTFLFAGFPAGLVLYWVWNNLLSIIQQLVITWVKFGGNQRV